MVLMLVIGAVIGFVLGAVVAGAVWATGRRPYLRVDVEHRDTHRQVVHHVLHHNSPEVTGRRVVAVTDTPDGMPRLRQTPPSVQPTSGGGLTR